MRESLREYVVHIFKHGRRWLSGAALGLIALVSAVGTFSLPWYVWLCLTTGCLSWVQFGAFSAMHRERDEARRELDHFRRPPELNGDFAFRANDVLRISVVNTAPTDIADALVNVTAPIGATMFQPCNPHGQPEILGNVSPEHDAGYWLWHNDGIRFRGGSTVTRFFFQLVLPDEVGVGVVEIAVTHASMPGGWRQSILVDDIPFEGARVAEESQG